MVFLLHYAQEFTCSIEVVAVSVKHILVLQVASKHSRTPLRLRDGWAMCHAYTSPLAGGNSETVTWYYWKQERTKTLYWVSDKAVCCPHVFLASSESCLGNLLKLTYGLCFYKVSMNREVCVNLFPPWGVYASYSPQVPQLNCTLCEEHDILLSP